MIGTLLHVRFLREAVLDRSHQSLTALVHRVVTHCR